MPLLARPLDPIRCDSLVKEMSLELLGRSDLATAPWPQDIGRLSARSLACFLPCVLCPSSLQGQAGAYTGRGSRRKSDKMWAP